MFLFNFLYSLLSIFNCSVISSHLHALDVHHILKHLYLIQEILLHFIGIHRMVGNITNKLELLWFYLWPRNCSNPKIKGAVVFHHQGPQLFDYSIRLNHTWAFSGFPDVKTIMDTNGPYLNDLELGVNIIPTMQYSFSGFLTVWTNSSFLIVFILTVVSFVHDFVVDIIVLSLCL